MNQQNLQPDMLDLLPQPAFYVQDGVITRVNQAATQKLLTPGTQVAAILQTGADEYSQFSGGSLHLTVTTEGTEAGATVTRIGDKDVFVLDQSGESEVFTALSLAAQELREPLSTIMTTSERLFPAFKESANDNVSRQLSQFNQGLYKMLRLIGNMSYAGRYSKSGAYMQTCNIRMYFEELTDTAELLIAKSGRTIVYHGLETDLFCLVNQEQLERAYYNLLSNAVKFSPEGAAIHVTLSRNGRKLFLTVENPKDDYTGKDFFTSFLREPGINDGRCGLGLGMVLVRAVARSHEGTVLVEQTDSTAKVTMTLCINQKTTTAVRSPILRVDYAGERDHGLLELSDALPPEAY